MGKQGTSELHAQLVRYALGLPGAFEDHPWGETVAKVGKKVFVFFGMGNESDPHGVGIGVKLPHSGSVALGLPFVEPTGYGLGKSGWVSVKFPRQPDLPAAMFEEWILESYRAVAPKTLVKQLDAGGPPVVTPKKASPKKAAPKKKAAKKATPKKTAPPKKRAAKKTAQVAAKKPTLTKKTAATKKR